MIGCCFGITLFKLLFIQWQFKREYTVTLTSEIFLKFSWRSKHTMSMIFPKATSSHFYNVFGEFPYVSDILPFETKIFPHWEKRFDWIKENNLLNDFLWFKEMIYLNETKFVWFKQNIFGPNKYLFQSNKFLP